MRNKRYYVLALLIIIIIIGIFYFGQNNNKEIQPFLVVDNQVKIDSIKNKDQNIVDYEKSLNIWNKLKKQYNDSYTYEVSFTSWTGYKNKTTISIINGIPVARTYKESIYNGPDSKEEKPYSFVEDKSNLNLNEKGAQAIAVDEIYKQCINDYLKVDSKLNKISFKVDSNGIIEYCGYRPNNCVDDCDKSLRIDNLKWLK